MFQLSIGSDLVQLLLPNFSNPFWYFHFGQLYSSDELETLQCLYWIENEIVRSKFKLGAYMIRIPFEWNKSFDDKPTRILEIDLNMGRIIFSSKNSDSASNLATNGVFDIAY